MKCNIKRELAKKQAMEQAEREQKEQEYIESLSEEERTKYLEEKKQRIEKSWKTLASMNAVLARAGIKRYY